MARVIVTLKVMPTGTTVDLVLLEKKVKEKIIAFAGKTETKTEIEPIAFGLKAVKILFVMDEEKGSTEDLENQVSAIAQVQSVQVTDVRRSVG